MRRRHPQSWPCGRPIGQPGRTPAIFADPPELALGNAIGNEGERWVRSGQSKGRDEAARVRGRLIQGVTPDLDEQPSIADREELHGSAREAEEIPAHAFDGQGAFRQERGDRNGRCDVIWEPDDEHDACGRWANKSESRRADDCTRALRPDDRARDVKAALGQEPVEGVAGHPTRPRRELAADQAGPRFDKST